MRKVPPISSDNFGPPPPPKVRHKTIKGKTIRHHAHEVHAEPQASQNGHGPESNESEYKRSSTT